MAETFSVGMTYWPRRTGYRSWITFDRGAAREELAHIAAMGCDTVRLCLRWEDFQPQPNRVGSSALRALEQTLDSAAAAGLRAALILFPVGLAGVIQVPRWATNVLVRPSDDTALATRYGPLLAGAGRATTTLYDDGYHTVAIQDLYRDRKQLDAQRYLVREVVGYFGQHPAAWAWQLGLDLERAVLPRSPDDGYEWLAALSELAREQGATHLLGGISTRALTRPEPARPEHVADTSDLLALGAWPLDPLIPTDPTGAAAPLLLHALAASLGAKPALVTSLGLPTAPDDNATWVPDRAFGRRNRSYLADEEGQARFVERSLLGLYKAGAKGVWLAAYADAPPHLVQDPPFDQCRREQTLGVVRGDGREKPAADALRSFAAQLRAGRLGPQGTPETALVDPEAYWRNPSGELTRLLREWEGDLRDEG